jgi:hypothetical protein
MRTRLRRSLLVSLGVLALLWAPPLLDQARPHRGNLGELWRFWTAHHRDTVGFTSAVRLLAPQFSIPSPWITGREPTSYFGGLLAPGFHFPYALVVLAVAALVAWRRRDHAAMAACSIAATASVAALVSVAKIVDTPYPYLLRWTWAVGAACWLASGIALIPPVVRRIGPRNEAWLARALAGVATALVVVIAVGAWSAAPPDQNESRFARKFLARVLPRLHGLREPILVDAGRGGLEAGSMRAALIYSAVAHGVDARFPASQGWAVGTDRAVEPNAAGTRIIIAAGDDVASYEHDPAYKEIAKYDSLTPSERRTYERRNDALSRAVASLSARQLDAYVTAHQSAIRALRNLGLAQYFAAVFIETSSR